MLDEYPLMVLPQLAAKIGLNEAIVLQQVNYWIIQCGKERDNRLWIFNTYDDWKKQFPFFSLSTIVRTIKKLENLGLLITGNYNKLKIDQTKWYTIDFDVLNSRYVQNDKACNSPIVQNDQMDYSNWIDQQPKMNRPLPETSSEINSYNTKDKASLLAQNGASSVDNFTSDAKEVYQYFINAYQEQERKVHPSINKSVIDKLNVIMEAESIYDPDTDKELYIDLDAMYAMIDRYFKTDYKLRDGGYADHRIYHFLSDAVLKNLYYHEGY